MDDPNNELQQTTLGTITTMAPEVLQRKPYGVKVSRRIFRLMSGRLELSSSR